MKNVKRFLVILFITSSNFCFSQQWTVYRDSAELYNSQKAFDKAEAAFIKANDLIPSDSLLRPMYSSFLVSMGNNYSSSGDAGNFIPALEKAKKRLLQQGEFTTTYAFVCNYLGNLYNNRGHFDTAMALHLKAKEIREKLLGKDDPFYAQSCNNLGNLYADMGRFAEAEGLILAAKIIREKIKPEKKTPQYAITCVALANLYQKIGQYGKAEQLYLEAKAIRGADSTGRASEDYAKSCNILADLYSYLNRNGEAEALYLEAKTVREKINNKNYNYGQSCNNLANLYQGIGRYQEALPLALEAKEIYDTVLDEDHASRVIQLNNLGELYAAMGDFKKSETYFLQARKLWEKNLGVQHPYFISNTDELARLYWKWGQVEKAASLISIASRSKYEGLSQVFNFTSEAEKALYLKNITGSNDEYYSFFYKNLHQIKPYEAFTISLQNRNLILSSIQQIKQSIYNSNDKSLIETYKEFSGIKEQLANLYSLSGEAKPSIIRSLEEKAALLEKDLVRKSSSFETTSIKPQWEWIQEKLSPNEAAIEFIEFNLFDGRNWTDSTMYAALLLKKTGQPIFVPLFEKKKLDNILSLVKSDDGSSINKLYSSSKLYEFIWKPIDKHLQSVKKIYCAAAGLLHNVSFSAMPVNGKQLLGDKYRVAMLNTTASVNNQRPEQLLSEDKITLYGGIEYDVDTTDLKASVVTYRNEGNSNSSFADGLRGGKTFQYLPGTKNEVEAIKKMAQQVKTNASVFTGVNASEEALVSLNGPSSPAVLHIATHGFFFPDPANDKTDSVLLKFQTGGKVFRQSSNPLMRSGLLFAGGNTKWTGRSVSGVKDGILTAYEVSNLYFPNTKLVVLSACKTALGDIQGAEGVYGLQRAFKVAGAQNLVMSLWKVPDAETAEFMQEFYKQLLNKQSITDSFYKAQTAMKNKYRNEPYKWAAWVLLR